MHAYVRLQEEVWVGNQRLDELEKVQQNGGVLQVAGHLCKCKVWV